MKFPNGVCVFKWPHKVEPTAELVKSEMEKHQKDYHFEIYDLQTIPPWYERGLHAHDYDEIRGAVEGTTTFYFDGQHTTIEGGDIILIPGGVIHEVRSHNPRSFTAFKGSSTGIRSVTEHA